MLATGNGVFIGLLTWLEFNNDVYIRKPLALEGPNEFELQYLDLNMSRQPYVLPFTMEKTNEYLQWDENSQTVQKGSSVLRYDHVRIASCRPIEDAIMATQGIEDGDEVRWIMTSIFDGHFGWQTAVMVRGFLLPYIIRELQSFGRYIVDIASQPVDQAIKKAFLDLDSDLVDGAASAVLGPISFADALSSLGDSYSGSCALFSFYNSDTRLLKIACTGDSRAVLGRRNARGQYDALPLSTPHTADSPSEIARLRAAHPNEPDLLQNNRLLGLRPTRAFGDYRRKWSRELQNTASERFHYPPTTDPVPTPPYVTAEPDITTTAIRPENADFLIMASSGLWRHLTPAQAVGLVARWLDTHDPSREAPPPDLTRSPPSSMRPPADDPDPDPPTAYSLALAADPDAFVVRDANAATHLARNALGGGDEDKLMGMLVAAAPLAGFVRDDISIQVVFFGPDPNMIEDLE